MRKITLWIIVLALLVAIAPEFTTSAEASVMHRIVNNTGYTVTRVFIRRSSSDSWGRNWLEGHGNLRTGNDLQVSLEPGTYDIMLVDTDGDTYIRMRQGVRENMRTTFTIDHMTRG